MQFLPIKTRELSPPKDDIYEVFDSSLLRLHEKDIVVITSKIVSIHEGRCFKKEEVSKQTKIIEESEAYLFDEEKSGRIISISHHAFSLGAGIDGFDDYLVLLPENPMKSAKEIQQYLKTKYSLSQVGVIITDSHSVPLRRGVVCYTIGYFGISPLIEHGTKNKYAKWTSNVVDSIAGMAGMYLGESAQLHQKTPIVIARDIEHVVFSDETFESSFFVQGKGDMYASLYKNFKRKK